MTIKIKAIKKGAEAGEIVELSPAEKVPLILQEALIEHPEFKDKIHVWIKDCKVGNIIQSPLGEPLKKKYTHGTYEASGEVTVNCRSLEKDALLAPRTKSYTIKFHDRLDYLGLPDLELYSLEFHD